MAFAVPNAIHNIRGIQNEQNRSQIGSLRNPSSNCGGTKTHKRAIFTHFHTPPPAVYAEIARKPFHSIRVEPLVNKFSVPCSQNIIYHVKQCSNCFEDKIPWVSKHFVSCQHPTFSTIFDIYDILLIGRKSLKCDGVSIFGIGPIIDIFHTSGNSPVSIDLLIRAVMKCNVRKCNVVLYNVSINIANVQGSP